MMELDRKILLFSGISRDNFDTIVKLLRNKGFKFDADKNTNTEFSLDDIYMVTAVHMLITRLFYPAEDAAGVVANNLLDKDTLMFIVDRHILYSGIKTGVLEVINDSERE